jgi:NhaP-type Na+/H+ and K+/H+ antiporter
MNVHAGLRPCVAITASVLVFALLIEPAGLIPAVIAAVLVAGLGSRAIRLREVMIFAMCLAAAMALLFVGLLRQPFTVIAGF